MYPKQPLGAPIDKVMNPPAPHDPINLAEFPTELLIHILDFLDADDVSLRAFYSLATMCKRFHDLFLPRFLARFHISDPEDYSELVFVGRGAFSVLDALSGVQISFIRSIRDLVCRFQVPRGEAEVDIVIMHLQRLYSLVSSLESVKNVTLAFAEGDSECGCCLGSRQGETLDRVLEQWSTTMGRTTSKILEKGCQSLTICGGKYMVHSYYYKRSRRAKQASPDGTFFKIKKFVGGKTRDSNESSPSDSKVSQGQADLLNILRGDEWEFDRATGTGSTIVLTKLSNAAKGGSTLRSLTLQSRMMFVPPLLHILVSILRLPTLETLTIANTSMHKKFWPTVFTLVTESARPNLKHLNLSGIRQIQATDLLEFISSFPRLVSLHLGKDIQHVDQFDLGLFPDFPYLRTLHAPAPWVFNLFNSQKMGLTRLESLEVVYNLRNDGLVHWIRRPKVVSLPTLLNLNLGPEAHRPLTVSLRVHLGKNPGLKMTQDVQAGMEAAVDGDGDGYYGPSAMGAQGPDEMTLVFDEELKKDYEPIDEVLGEWLELFGSLKEIEVITMPPRSISNDEAMALVLRVMEDGGLASLKCVRVNGIRIDPID